MRFINHLFVASLMGVTGIASSHAEFTATQASPERLAQISLEGNSDNRIKSQVYVVQLRDNPVVAYTGNIKGLKATKPQTGKKINPNSAAVTKYVEYLDGTHTDMLAQVGGGKKLYNFRYSFNGFAAELSAAQANKLRAMDGVVEVYEDELLFLDTATTPDFLGLTAPDGLWDQLGGVGSAGEDIIIGIVDGGIWPESLSFTDRTGANGNASKTGKLSYQQIPGWHGKCVPGEAFNASMCNQKLIGARYYNAAWGGNEAIDAAYPYEFLSPRDFGGHGTHTASTAGGNNNVPVTGPAAVFGSVSGIAPRARIAAYKTCWQTPSGGSCFGSDSIAAIDQAVADGVDVINYSISGSRTNFRDAVEIAFLFAADAGVFVAASAGNSGPTASTVAHPGPWLTTVAASTHDRYYEADVTLGNGVSYTGASSNVSGAGPADLVYSANVGLGGADATEVRLCYPGTLDPALVTGKIVLCDRGVIARVDKSLAVAQAGGVGSILVNTSNSTLDPDFHSVPTVHLSHIHRPALLAYVATPSPTAEIFTSVFSPAPAPAIASFSSRGPLLAGGGDLLKPDVSAPGVAILAAVAPPGNGDQDFALYQGTSMSSPHVAGLGALLKDLHPDWSPMMIKSALMTTATDLISGANPFHQGAGHVRPNSAADPGLVYDHGFNDWIGFICGTGQLTGPLCTGLTIDPSDLNVASISIGALVGSQTVTRTVTSVADTSENYTFSGAITGFDISANPSSFDIAPGESRMVEITFTRTSATLNAIHSGFIRWTGDEGHVVRSPVVLKPTLFATSAEVDGTADGAGDGSVNVPVSFGYTGVYTADVSGLEGSLPVPGNVTSDEGLEAWCIDLPAMKHLRFAMFDEDTSSPGADDLDLRVFRGNTDCATWTSTTLLGSSGTATTAEVVDLTNPIAGSYIGVVVYFGAANGTDSNYTLWIQPVVVDNANTSLTAPASAVTGTSGTVIVDYTGVAPSRNLGILHHRDGVGEIGRTILDIDARP